MSPLVIRDPGGAKGVEERVNSNVDIMPTLLSKCGLAVPEGVQGIALPEPGSRCQRDYAYETGYSKIGPEFHHPTFKNFNSCASFSTSRKAVLTASKFSRRNLQIES